MPTTNTRGLCSQITGKHEVRPKMLVPLYAACKLKPPQYGRRGETQDGQTPLLYLEVMGQVVTNENFTLENCRHFFPALAQRQAALQITFLDATHESPEVRDSLIRHHVFVVAARNINRPRGGSDTADGLVATTPLIISAQRRIFPNRP